VNDQLKKKWKK